LFPDVLLFGDSAGSVIQQGWELKFPNTPVTDADLLQNAEEKARRLGLNSYLVWNVDEAVLYVKDPSGNFEHSKSWPRTNICRRGDVLGERVRWGSLLHSIIDDINDLLDGGSISGAMPSVAISDSLFLDLLNQYSSYLSTAIETACRASATLSAEVDLWWAINRIEHPLCTKFQGLARVNLVNWVNRFLFAHYLKRFHGASRAVETIKRGTSVHGAIAIFDTISTSCDFLNVFKPAPGQEHVDRHTWAALVSLNEFLTDFRLDTILQESFQQILEGALTYSRKKLAGQYATPKTLADFLVRINIEDRSKPIIDPCCGTGTIARAAYDLKRSLGIPISDAVSAVWASDKFAFPLQLCSIALSDPLGMGEVILVFRYDAFDLRPGVSVSFIDPNDGTDVSRNIPQVHAVVSNFPFVRFEDIAALNPLISTVASEIIAELGPDGYIDNRADLYAYLIIHLRHLLEPSGRVGVIVSNSWLGTDWGRKFRPVLSRYFKVLRVVISGAGRWFSNTDVVTTIICLEKCPLRSAPPSDESIEFITMKERIDDWRNVTGGIEGLADEILAGREEPTKFRRNRYTRSRLDQLEKIGLGWSAFFVDLSWVAAIESNLVPVNSYFNIKRGERRGWDAMFYPPSGHGIEAEYIKPVLLSPRDVVGLFATPDGEAFCCSDDITILRRTGKSGALAWIRRFETATNTTGRLLPIVLARSGHYWYEMKPVTLADFVVPMNPDKRLCVHRFAERSFVNQRLIRMTVKPSARTDLDLCHALMNSVVGMFQIEAAGFGRGLGALDLNAGKMKKHFHMLNPSTVSTEQRTSILKAFSPLLIRNVLDLPDELLSSDRRAFDEAVLSAVGASHLLDAVYSSLLNLFDIRQTARL
jgi:hypothetical protein